VVRDDLTTPLHDVTFVVVDLETTGGSPTSCAITEIGAVRYRGGDCQGVFQTLVDPGAAEVRRRVPQGGGRYPAAERRSHVIAPMVTQITGITDAMLVGAPSVGGVLASWLEFARGAVLVGHNVRFDISFLDAALVLHGFPPLEQHRVDTLALARRLVKEDVVNLQLGTVAEHLHARTEPVHRALEDARATADVLHALLERLGTIGVLRLGDLLDFPSRPVPRPKPYDGRRLVARRDP